MVSALATCPSWLMLFPNEAAWCLVLMWLSTGVAFVWHRGTGGTLKLLNPANSVYVPGLITTVYLTQD